MLALFGAFDPADDLSRPAFLTFMTIAAFGTLLTAAYMLVVVRRVCMGAAPQEGPNSPTSSRTSSPPGPRSSS